MLWITAILAVGLGVVHIVAGRLKFLDVIPRSRWLSMAGGASVAYVFVHILPDLSRGQQTIERYGSFGITFLETHVYLIALVGLVVFYGLDRAAVLSRARRAQTEGQDSTEPGVFWLHMVSFSLYNALIGYLLLHRERPGLASLLIYFFAMALHFVVNDYGLKELHKEAYESVGRWILVGAVLVGWAVGAATQIHEAAIASLFAFLAGGVVLNVIKEELPEERRSSFWAFLTGVAAYAVVVLLA